LEYRNKPSFQIKIFVHAACNIWNHDAEDIDDRSAFEIYAIRARLQNGRGKNDSARQNATKALQLLKQVCNLCSKW
jgi:hypothetical protein